MFVLLDNRYNKFTYIGLINGAISRCTETKRVINGGYIFTDIKGDILNPLCLLHIFASPMDRKILKMMTMTIVMSERISNTVVSNKFT